MSAYWDYPNAAEMRRQTSDYLEAVYDAHPELRPRRLVLEPVPEPVFYEVPEVKLPQPEETVDELIARLEEATELPPKGTALKILKAIASHHGLTVTELKGPGRTNHIARARQHAMYEIRRHTQLSFPQIGAILGKRDHTTILHGIKKHIERLAQASD